MNFDKAEVKIGTFDEVGNKLDDVLEAMQAEASRMEGAAVAFGKGAEAVAALLQHVDKDTDEGTLDLEVAKHVKRYLDRARVALVNLGMNASNQSFVAKGRVIGLQTSVGVVKKFKTEAENNRAVMLSVLASQKEGAPGVEVRDGRPVSLPLKAVRLAEEAQKAAAPAPRKKGRRK
jgi:hypothetical protein